MHIYNIAQIVRDALHLVATSENIQSGIRISGI